MPTIQLTVLPACLHSQLWPCSRIWAGEYENCSAQPTSGKDFWSRERERTRGREEKTFYLRTPTPCFYGGRKIFIALKWKRHKHLCVGRVHHSWHRHRIQYLQSFCVQIPNFRQKLMTLTTFYQEMFSVNCWNPFLFTPFESSTLLFLPSSTFSITSLPRNVSNDTQGCTSELTGQCKLLSCSAILSVVNGFRPREIAGSRWAVD